MSSRGPADRDEKGAGRAPSKRDPLDARRIALISQGEYTVLELEHTPTAAPWLRAVGFDPVQGAAKLRAFVAATQTTDRDVSLRARRGRVLEERVRAELASVRTWRSTVRSFLKNACPSPVSQTAADQIRSALKAPATRHAGTLTMLNATFRAWDAYGPLLALPELRDALRAEGDGLWAELDELAAQVAAHKLVYAAEAEAAAVATIALRQELVEVRKRWRSGRKLSRNAFGPLDLSVGAADVGARASRKAGSEAPAAAEVDPGEPPVVSPEPPRPQAGAENTAEGGSSGESVTVVVAVSGC